MIVRKEFSFPAAGDGHDMYGCLWLDDGYQQYKAVLQIAHGMEEHMLRYQEFAVFLAQQGFLVCGNDHTGHGRSIEHWEDRGFFGEETDSWKYLVDDMHQVKEIIQRHYPSLPYFLLGHSMGSFLAREFTAEYPTELKGVIYMGTSGGHPLLDAGIFLCDEGVRLKGAKARGYAVNRLAFGAFNLKFLPKRTDYDWLSSDKEAVKNFMEDEQCGFVFTYAGYRELFRMLKQVSGPLWAKKIPKDLPILILSGKNDPVGDYGRGIEKVVAWLRDSGCTMVTAKLYEGGRHELLNEVFRNQVYRYLLKWLHEAMQ